MVGIATAIRERRLLQFEYAGYTRVVEPHIYGLDSTGDRALSAYQVRGGSKSGEFVGWKMFREDRMTGLAVLAESFSGPRDEYNRDDAAFRMIVARL